MIALSFLLMESITMDELSNEVTEGIEQALEDFKAGRVHSEESIMEEFGLL